MLSSGDKIGSYTIRERAGAGGMATVYKAWHEGLHRHEALKVPRGAGEGTADSAYVLRLLSEARVAAQLHHPNIVAIHNVSEVDAAVPFFAMDWVDGEDLSQILKIKKQFSLNETIEILQPVAQALDYAHSQGVVHRDVKPANILLENKSGRWVPHVVDFGISRAAEDEEGATKLTKSGMLVGTPEYMSPEQAGSGEIVDNRTDIYSLGIVAYEMLCGTPPFTAGQGVSRLSILVAHVNKEVPLFQIQPDFPKEVGKVLLLALAKSPKARPQTCAGFIAELSAVAAETPSDDLLPIIASTKDIRTPFDGSRFDIDNEATLIQRFPDAAKPTQPEPVEAEVEKAEPVVETPKPEATTKQEIKSGPSDTVRSYTNEASKANTLPIEKNPEIVPDVAQKTPPLKVTSVRPHKKSATTKVAFFAGGALILVLGIAGLASMSMQRLQITTPPVAETPTPRAEVSISTPTVVTEKQPQVTTKTVQVTRMREVPFETEVRSSRKRFAGQQSIIQKGQLGTREVILAITMDGTREVARKKVSERDVLQPVKQIVEIGTRSRATVRRPRVRTNDDSPRTVEVSKPNVATRPAAPAQKVIKREIKVPASPRVREAPLPP